jgi:hypothetical protein
MTNQTSKPKRTGRVRFTPEHLAAIDRVREMVKDGTFFGTEADMADLSPPPPLPQGEDDVVTVFFRRPPEAGGETPDALLKKTKGTRPQGKARRTVR